MRTKAGSSQKKFNRSSPARWQMRAANQALVTTNPRVNLFMIFGHTESYHSAQHHGQSLRISRGGRWHIQQTSACQLTVVCNKQQQVKPQGRTCWKSIHTRADMLCLTCDLLLTLGLLRQESAPLCLAGASHLHKTPSCPQKSHCIA